MEDDLPSPGNSPTGSAGPPTGQQFAHNIQLMYAAQPMEPPSSTAAVEELDPLDVQEEGWMRRLGCARHSRVVFL